jgi:hypothetical protein
MSSRIEKAEKITSQLGTEVINFFNERLKHHIDNNFSLDDKDPNVLDVQDLLLILINSSIILPPAIFGILKDLFRGKDLDYRYIRVKITNTIAQHLDKIIEGTNETTN